MSLYWKAETHWKMWLNYKRKSICDIYALVLNINIDFHPNT